jgi:tetratricopeptide (TPR) repeat protein
MSVWVRRHLLVWIIAAAAMNGALLAVTTMLMQLPGQSDSVITFAILVVLACSALSIALPVIGHRVEERRRIAEGRQTYTERIATLLAHGSGSHLPRLEQVTLEGFGATPTRYTRTGNAPYIPRSPDDEQLRTILKISGPPYPFVLVWGPTKAGKSRVLAEALRAAFPTDTQVLIPASGPALAELAHLGLPFTPEAPILVYLDDLTVADLEALTASVLDTVAARGVLAATMTAERRSQVLASGGDVTRIARSALARAHNDGNGHELTFRPPTPAELAQAQRLYPEESFRGSIAETLVGGAELIAKYRAGQDTNPAGYAIVQAAIDCRRAGVNRPLTNPELNRLFALYLPRVRAGIPATASAYQVSLHEWAAVPIASQVALLTPNNAFEGTADAGAGWVVLDHAVSADEGTLEGYAARPIPDELWNELIDLASPTDAYGIMYAAYARQQTEHAVTAARKVMISPHPEAPRAALVLGFLLSKQGDVEGARKAYQQAIDSGNDDASMAAQALGPLLLESEDVDDARKAYKLAVEFGHNELASLAALNLGRLLEKQQNFEGARKAYQQAIDSGNDEASMAAQALGFLLLESEDVDDARKAYKLAVEFGHNELASLAALNLGRLLEKQRDLEGAREAYQQVIDSGSDRNAAYAQQALDALFDAKEIPPA